MTPSPPTTDDGPRDGFRGRTIFVVFVIFGMATLFAAAWALRTLLLITFLAVLLASVLRALGDLVHRATGLKQKWGVLLVAAILTLLVVGAGLLLAPTIAEQGKQLVEKLPAALQSLRDRLGEYPWLAPILERVSSGMGEAKPGEAMGQAGQILGSVSEALGYAGLALGGALFLALEPGLYRRGLIKLVPVRHRPFAGDVLDDLDHTILQWLGAQLVLMVFIGVLAGVGLWAIGVPYALAIGVFAGLVEFIPYLGPILSAGIAILVALSADPKLALWTLGLFVVIQQVENNVLQPLIQKQAVEIPPVLLIVVLFAMGQLFGVPGILVATPLLGLVLVLVRRVYVEHILEKRDADAEPPRT